LKIWQLRRRKGIPKKGVCFKKLGGEKASTATTPAAGKLRSAVMKDQRKSRLLEGKSLDIRTDNKNKVQATECEKGRSSAKGRKGKKED